MTVQTTVKCPNCQTEINVPRGECLHCRFEVEQFRSRDLAVARWREWLRRRDVIVTEPVQELKGLWVVSYTVIALA